jgi:L-ribulokinase
LPVTRIVAAGGLPDRNKLLMQIYADVTNREFSVVKSALAGAVGAAMHGAVAAGSAAGGYDDIYAAAAKMGGIKGERYCPIAANVAIYDQLYAEYNTLHDYFGRGENDVMKRLRTLRRSVVAGS